MKKFLCTICITLLFISTNIFCVKTEKAKDPVTQQLEDKLEDNKKEVLFETSEILNKRCKEIDQNASKKLEEQKEKDLANLKKTFDQGVNSLRNDYKEYVNNLNNTYKEIEEKAKQERAQAYADETKRQKKEIENFKLANMKQRGTFSINKREGVFIGLGITAGVVISIFFKCVFGGSVGNK